MEQPNGRSHEPDLRQVVAEMDGLRGVMEERDRRYQAILDAMDDKTALALTSAKEAVIKAEIATEKRFDSVNEFRQTLNDYQTRLVTKPEYDTHNRALDGRLDDVKTELLKIRDIQTEMRGKGAGVSATWVVVLIIVPIISSIVFGVLAMIPKYKP
jgi:hypothetical protein